MHTVFAGSVIGPYRTECRVASGSISGSMVVIDAASMGSISLSKAERSNGLPCRFSTARAKIGLASKASSEKNIFALGYRDIFSTRNMRTKRS